MTSGDVLGALLPAVPFAAALVGFLLPLRARTLAAVLGVGGAGVVLVAAVVLLATDLPYENSREWIDFGDLPVTLGIRLDSAAALVAVAVGVVALAVQVYSVAYLHGDSRYAPYAAQVSLFTAAMLLVVVSGDLIMLLVGWEVMGICSYLLIGHDRTLPEAPRAAVKAFLVTRVGDVGFLVGIAVLGVHAGSFRISTVLSSVDQLSPTILTVAALLLLAGVAGKSAQFPLHTWLPDAMAGPTPISALIHAATMVAAGVYVVARLYPVFVAAPGALAVLGLMAAITLLLGALAATAQDDIKRVLAWSTVSQIGYMAGALAVGSVPAALFHLLTHAAFKALLFLAAGCVIHAVGSNLMSAMGGLRRGLPITFWSMVVGLGALAGAPPLAGFWSKDSILVAAEEAFNGHGPVPAWVGAVVWLAAVLGVAITAWYATRLLLLTFFGPASIAAPAFAGGPVAAGDVSGGPTAAPGLAGGPAAAGGDVGGSALASGGVGGPAAASSPTGSVPSYDHAPAGDAEGSEFAPGGPGGASGFAGGPVEAGSGPAGVGGGPSVSSVSVGGAGSGGGPAHDSGVSGHRGEAPGLMLWPVAALAVPSALLGMVLYAVPHAAEWLGADDRSALLHFGALTVLPLALVALGAWYAWWLWRRGGDPVLALGPARPVFARAFYLDDVQDALVVRPAAALARVVRRADESGVDGAVEGAGRGTLGLGGLLARVHRVSLPGAATAVLAGAVLLVILVGVRDVF